MIEVFVYIVIAGALLVVPAAVLLAVFAPNYTKRLYVSLGLGEGGHGGGHGRSVVHHVHRHFTSKGKDYHG